jgi:glycosyltransferase involved in cell wall biosynthesis
MNGIALYLHGSAEMYGSDKVLLNLAAAAAADAQFKPVVVLNEDGPLRQALQAAGVEVHVATVVKLSRAMFSPRAPIVLWRAISRSFQALDTIVAGRHVALVYSNTLGVLGGAVWARRRGLPHVWHVHEIILKPAVARWGLPRLASALSQHVVSNSVQTQAWLLSQVPQLQTRASVIFNGLAPLPEVPASEVQAFRTQIGALPGEVVVTVAGRLNHWKGQGLLVDALALLRQAGQGPALRLAIVGDVYAGHDDFKARLVQQVQTLGLQDCVCFVPFVSNIDAVWAGTDVAVVPSLDPEPFGMVAIEAMASGLPVVAAAHGGLLDIVEDQVTGLCFAPRQVRPLADAVARLAADPALRQRMGTAGAQRQRRLFSLQAQVQATRALFEGLTQQPAPLPRHLL